MTSKKRALARVATAALFISVAVFGVGHNATITPKGADTVGATSSKSLSAAAKYAVITAVGTDWKIVLAN